MPKSKNNKPTLIIFEGPDMCGKTSHVESITKLLVSKGYKATSFKYPDYTGKYGNEILDFLKSFNISDNSMPKNISLILAKERFDTYNKLFSKNKLIELSKNNDFIILDRFVMSQIIYTLAWVNILSSYKYNTGLKFRWSVHKYADIIDYIIESASNNYKDILEYFKEEFDIKTVMFKKSKFISHKAFMTRNSKDISKYDINEAYQICVSRLFEYVANNAIESIKIDTVNVTFLPPDSDNLKLDDFYKTLLNIKETSNIDGVIDTDSIFDNIIKEHNENHKNFCFNLNDYESEDEFIEDVLDNVEITDKVYETIDKLIYTNMTSLTNKTATK